MTFRLSDRVKANVHGKEYINSLRWWINNYPTTVYNMVYAQHKGLPHFKINKDAHSLLLIQLKKYDPLKVELIKGRRAKRLQDLAILQQLKRS